MFADGLVCHLAATTVEISRTVFRALQASAMCFLSFSIFMSPAGCPVVVGSSMSSTLSGTSWDSTHQYFRYVFLFPAVRLNIHVERSVTCPTRWVRAQRFHGNQRCHL